MLLTRSSAMRRVAARFSSAALPSSAAAARSYGSSAPALLQLQHSSLRRSDAQADVLVLGCGIAGASAALKAASQGCRVLMLSAAADAADCNSYWAQGGIIYKSPDDSPHLLASDVHAAGAGICNDAAVMKLACEGPSRVEEMLLQMAPVPFDRTPDGALALCLEASHNRARIIHWRDATGKAITQAVQAAAAQHPNIQLVTASTAVDLALAQGGPSSRGSAGGSTRCVGAHVLNASGQLQTLLAPATVLATGGLGELYAHTSNPASARGDGFAMALRAGAVLSNMEYVQFHPTTLHLPGERSFLLTEALRGEGARLLNPSGRAFARDYHPAGELAPRDVVSRMIVSELQRSGAEHVYLDISHREAGWLRKRFPSIHAHCLARGLDLTRDPLPVVPAAHYFCGGVAADLQGRTSLPGLFAAGEVACTGLHGGNRLASTSLLEGLVWGCAIADHLTGSSSAAEGGGAATVLQQLAADTAQASLLAPVMSAGTAPPDHAALAAAWQQLKQTMWQHVGVVRTQEGLAQAVHTMQQLARLADAAYASSALCPETAALRNAVDTAAVIAQAAASNPRSVGAHYVAAADEVEDVQMEEAMSVSA